jgi:hypothetical protein
MTNEHHADYCFSVRNNRLHPEMHPSAAKAGVNFGDRFGTTEVMPFQSCSAN